MPITTGSIPAALPGGSGKDTTMKGVSPRKSMAMGDSYASAMSSEADSAPSTGGDVVRDPNAAMDKGKTLSDDNRAHSGPVGTGRAGRMAMPGMVDHGPHNMPAGTNGMRPRGRG